jgi:hypothetical protein
VRIRIVIVIALALSLVVPTSSAVGQQPTTMLCVAVIGQAPGSGWDPVSLGTAIAAGDASFAIVADPALCASAGQPSPAATHDLSGSVEIRWDSGYATWTLADGVCWGRDAFADIAEGALVSVRDGDGSLLATGRLGVGKPSTGKHGQCTFPYDIPEVPDASFYAVGIADRGGPTYSRAEMDAQGWRLDLSIGGG